MREVDADHIPSFGRHQLQVRVDFGIFRGRPFPTDGERLLQRTVSTDHAGGRFGQDHPSVHYEVGEFVTFPDAEAERTGGMVVWALVVILATPPSPAKPRTMIVLGFILTTLRVPVPPVTSDGRCADTSCRTGSRLVRVLERSFKGMYPIQR
jgi:hypothetical protein